jgi:hypothetical protein
MDQAIISAAAGLTGSFLGGVSTFAASWLSTRRQDQIQRYVQHAARREEIYAEFIHHASQHLVHAWGHRMQDTENLAEIYSLLERIRLLSSDGVIAAAERVMQHIVAAYNAPNKDYNELQRRVMRSGIESPLAEFSARCREEASTRDP